MGKVSRMATVAKSDRSTLITLASATAGPFDLDFRLFDTDKLDVFVNYVARTDWTLNATFVDGYTDDAAITFDADLDPGDVIVINGELFPHRSQNYLNSGGLVQKLNIEFGRIWSSLSEQYRNNRRSLRFFQPVDPVRLEAGKSIITNGAGDGVEMGPTADEIASAQGYAEAASTSADSAATSAGNAEAASTAAIEAVAAISHPMAGPHHVFAAGHLRHPWLHSLFWHGSSSQSFMLVKEGDRHVQSYNAPLVLYRSIDHFNSYEDAKSVFSKLSEDVTQAVGGEMDSDRIGFLLSTRDASNNFEHYFIYSDDGGVTFSENANVIADAAKFFGYGPLIAAPSAATGLGADGYAAFGYGTGGIQITYTTDNGANWTNAIAVAAGAGSTVTPTEPFVLRLGTENKWVMLIRENGENLSLSFSSDLLSWSDPVETTYALGSHPASAVYESGKVYLYLASRNASPRIGDRNTMYMLTADAADLWSERELTGSLVPAFTSKSQLLGYTHSYEKDGQHYFAYCSGETEQGSAYASSSEIIVGSTIPRAAPPLVGSVNRNLLDNPYFSDWLRGTSLSISGVTKVASRWVYSPSGATGTVERASVPDDAALALPWNGRYCLSADLSSDNFGRFYQILSADPDTDGDGETIIRRMSDQIYTVQVWGYGFAPPGLYAQLEFDYGSGGSATENRTVSLNCNAVNDAVWFATVTTRAPAASGKTIGTGSEVRFAIGHTGTGAWSGKILGAKLEYGDTATQMAPEDTRETRERVSRYLQKMEYAQFGIIGEGIQRTAGRCEILMQSPGLFHTPTVTFSGSASDLELNSTNGTKTPTSITFEGASRNGFLLVANEATLTAGSARLRQTAAGTTHFLIDGEQT